MSSVITTLTLMRVTTFNRLLLLFFLALPKLLSLNGDTQGLQRSRYEREVVRPWVLLYLTRLPDIPHNLKPSYMPLSGFHDVIPSFPLCVAPKDEKLRLVAESVIEVATGVGGVGGVGGVVGELPPSPHPRSRSTAAKARSLKFNSSRIRSK